MDDTLASATPPSAGPRRRREILEATLGLVAELGYERLTIEGVAEAAGVNKTTIYRWWRSKGELLGAALLEAPLLELTVPDTGSFAGDLQVLTDRVAGLLTQAPAARVVTAVLAAAADNAELAVAAQRFFADRLTAESPVFERARARGELAEGVDPMLVMDLVAGALWARIVLRQQPLDPGFTRQVVTAALQGVLADQAGA